jgi:hypothetical protein
VRFTSSSPHVIASSSFDKTIKVWDLRAPSKPNYVVRSENSFVMICFSPDDLSILASAVDNQVTLFSAMDGRSLFNLDAPRTFHRHNFTRSYFMDGGDVIITGGSSESVVRFFCAHTGEYLEALELASVLETPAVYVQSLRGSPHDVGELSVIVNFRDPGRSLELWRFNRASARPILCGTDEPVADSPIATQHMVSDMAQLLTPRPYPYAPDDPLASVTLTTEEATPLSVAAAQMISEGAELSVLGSRTYTRKRNVAGEGAWRLADLTVLCWAGTQRVVAMAHLDVVRARSPRLASLIRKAEPSDQVPTEWVLALLPEWGVGPATLQVMMSFLYTDTLRLPDAAAALDSLTTVPRGSFGDSSAAASTPLVGSLHPFQPRGLQFNGEQGTWEVLPEAMSEQTAAVRSVKSEAATAEEVAALNKHSAPVDGLVDWSFFERYRGSVCGSRQVLRDASQEDAQDCLGSRGQEMVSAFELPSSSSSSSKMPARASETERLDPVFGMPWLHSQRAGPTTDSEGPINGPEVSTILIEPHRLAPCLIGLHEACCAAQVLGVCRLGQLAEARAAAMLSPQSWTVVGLLAALHESKELLGATLLWTACSLPLLEALGLRAPPQVFPGVSRFVEDDARNEMIASHLLWRGELYDSMHHPSTARETACIASSSFGSIKGLRSVRDISAALAGAASELRSALLHALPFDQLCVERSHLAMQGSLEFKDEQMSLSKPFTAGVQAFDSETGIRPRQKGRPVDGLDSASDTSSDDDEDSDSDEGSDSESNEMGVEMFESEDVYSLRYAEALAMIQVSRKLHSMLAREQLPSALANAVFHWMSGSHLDLTNYLTQGCELVAANFESFVELCAELASDGQVPFSLVDRIEESLRHSGMATHLSRPISEELRTRISPWVTLPSVRPALAEADATTPAWSFAWDETTLVQRDMYQMEQRVLRALLQSKAASTSWVCTRILRALVGGPPLRSVLRAVQTLTRRGAAFTMQQVMTLTALESSPLADLSGSGPSGASSSGVSSSGVSSSGASSSAVSPRSGLMGHLQQVRELAACLVLVLERHILGSETPSCLPSRPTLVPRVPTRQLSIQAVHSGQGLAIGPGGRWLAVFKGDTRSQDINVSPMMLFDQCTRTWFRVDPRGRSPDMMSYQLFATLSVPSSFDPAAGAVAGVDPHPRGLRPAVHPAAHADLSPEMAMRAAAWPQPRLVLAAGPARSSMRMSLKIFDSETLTWFAAEPPPGSWAPCSRSGATMTCLSSSTAPPWAKNPLELFSAGTVAECLSPEAERGFLPGLVEESDDESTDLHDEGTPASSSSAAAAPAIPTTASIPAECFEPWETSHTYLVVGGAELQERDDSSLTSRLCNRVEMLRVTCTHQLAWRDNRPKVLTTVSSSWRRPSVSGPRLSPRFCHAACAFQFPPEQGGPVVFVHGGRDNRSMFSDCACISVHGKEVEWHSVTAQGCPPSFTDSHTIHSLGPRTALLLGGNHMEGSSIKAYVVGMERRLHPASRVPMYLATFTPVPYLPGMIPSPRNSFISCLVSPAFRQRDADAELLVFGGKNLLFRSAQGATRDMDSNVSSLALSVHSLLDGHSTLPTRASVFPALPQFSYRKLQQLSEFHKSVDPREYLTGWSDWKDRTDGVDLRTPAPSLLWGESDPPPVDRRSRSKLFRSAMQFASQRYFRFTTALASRPSEPLQFMWGRWSVPLSWTVVGSSMALPSPPVQSSTLAEDLSRLLEALNSSSSSFSDGAVALTSEVDGGEVLAHRWMLILRSSRFRKALMSSLSEGASRKISVSDIPSTTLRDLVRFFYSDCLRPDIAPEEAMQLLIAARSYTEDRLARICEAALMRFLDVDNAAGMLQFADRYACADLQQAATAHILANFKAVQESGDLECLEPEIQEELLRVWSSVSHAFALEAQRSQE